MIDDRVVRITLIVLETLMGLAAIVSGTALIATNGLGMPVEWMENSPFGSYTVPGLVLLVVGMFNLWGAVAVLRHSRLDAVISMAVGVMWIGWFVVQVAVVGFVSWQQPFYFVISLLILSLSTLPLVGWFRAGARAIGRR